MKKRILSIVLAICMVMTLMPQAVVASDWENKIWIGDTPVNKSTNMTDNSWVFFPGYNVLVLGEDFVRVTSSNLPDSKDKAVIRVESLDNLTIQLQGNATVGVSGTEYLPPEASNGISTYGIYAPNTNLSIEGSGTLNVNSNANAIWCKDLKVEGPTLNCNSNRTAIRVIDSSASIDTAQRGNMLVKSGANVNAKTIQGSGLYPETFVLGGNGADYRDNGGAAILVSGSLTVENSTVNAENSCNELPEVTSGFKGILDKSNVFYGNSFCTTIFVWNDLTVSGSDASVTGKLRNTTSGYADSNYSFKFGAVVANKMYVKEGGTLEGFITTTYHSEFAQGLRRIHYDGHGLNLPNALISRSGEGTVRAGIVNIDVAVETPEYADSPYYVEENFSPTEKYGNHLEITIRKVSTVYLRTTDSGPELSFQSNFGRAYSLDSTTIDLRDYANSVFVQKGCLPEWGFPEIYVKSGDWTIIPPCETEADYYIEAGNLTIQPQDGMEYAGGSAHIDVGATLIIDGDGIAKNWDVSACQGANSAGGTLRFVSGTVENASASIGISVYIIGGNINFNPIPIMQNVKNQDGTKLYKDVYLMGSNADELIEINTGEGTITPKSSYYYPIGYDNALVVWTINDLPIKYVTVAPEDGESYNLISGGVIESLGNEYHSLVRAERYRKFVPNPNYRFFRNPDESVTMNAAGSINTYENRLDSGLVGPYLISSTTDLDSSLRAEWSYQNENGEKVVVGGNSLTCTIDDLSDIVNYRTYTCTVYEKAADGSEKAIGSYNANVYVMRWEQPDTIYAAIGKEVTFTASPSEETKWAAGFLSTLKWQVNKGSGWEDIPDSNTDSYTVTITEENADCKYRRVIYGFIIGNFDKHESNIYVEMHSPELSAILTPQITSQPQSIRIQENDTTKHELSVRANNAESYQWQKKVDGTFVDIEGAASSTLKVGPQDAGTYRCVVSNRFGETVSEEASVEVRPAPTCGTPTGGNAALGAKAELYASFTNVSGDGSVQIKWQYSTDEGATWVDVVSMDPSDNISMFYVVIEFGYKPIDPPGATIIIDSRIDGASMTINKTTADMDGWKVRCVLTDAVGVYYSNTVELSIEMPDYTVTFDTDGGTEIASKTTVQWTDKVLDGVLDPTKEGWKFIGWKYKDVTVTPQTTYRELAVEGTVLSIELKAQWEDIAGPTGEISIAKNSWKEFLNKITFNLFFKDTQPVTITASDNSGEPVTIMYLLSDKSLTVDELAAKEFITYTDEFSIEPNNEWIIYVKLIDKAGNVTYLSSDGIVLDHVAPVISGIENGKTYCEAQTVTIDEKYIDSVTVNGKEVTLENNQFILKPADGTQTIVATDMAGNVSTEITVTVNDGHTYEWQSENGQYWQKCKFCDDETAKKDIPAITINGANLVCATQDYKFSFTLPEGATDVFYGYEFEFIGAFGLEPIMEDGKLYGVVTANSYDLSESSFKVCVNAKTADGFDISTSRIVVIQSEHIDITTKDHICDICGTTLSEHTGGEATCISKAICDHCGEEYGEININHHDLEKISAKAASVTETGNIEYWHCKDCGKCFSDPDAKNGIELEDTVIPKLPPEIIEGKEQIVAEGEKNELSFTSDATFSDFIQVELDGKILDEKNYTIKKDDMVVTLKDDFVATLPSGEHTIGIVSKSGTATTTFTVKVKEVVDNTTNTPQTGDNNQMVLWIALLFVCSGAMITTTVVSKKKKRSKTENQ